MPKRIEDSLLHRQRFGDHTIPVHERVDNLETFTLISHAANRDTVAIVGGFNAGLTKVHEEIAAAKFRVNWPINALLLCILGALLGLCYLGRELVIIERQRLAVGVDARPISW